MKKNKKSKSNNKSKNEIPKIKSIFLVGLGNPTEEYENTRHNVGRDACLKIAKDFNFSDFKENQSVMAELAKGKIGKKSAVIILPNTFMNKSGFSVSKIVKKTDLAGLLVIQDDLDLPLGKIKTSYNRGSGGHRGVDSIIKAMKSQAFIRIRIGVSKIGRKGEAKKPNGEEAVIKFILGKFKLEEEKELKKVFKRIVDTLPTLAEQGILGLMNRLN